MAYIGVNDIAKKITNLYIGNNSGIAKKVLKAYVGDENGIARLWWDGSDSYKYPMLKPKDTWFTSDSKQSITTINIVDSYTPTGNEDESWAADVNETGAITCYRTGTELVIAGDGSGKIYTNPDSERLFSTYYGTYPGIYFENVTTISGLSYLDTSKTTNMAYMFHGLRKLTSIDVSSLDTSNALYMTGMFAGCYSLTSLNVSNFDTSNVIDMMAMFCDCYSLTSLDLSNFNTSKVEYNMNHMFQNCYSLTSLDVSNFDTSHVQNMSNMFEGCSNIPLLDLTSFNLINVRFGDYMFKDCPNLTKIYVSFELWHAPNTVPWTDPFKNCGTDHVTYV